MKQKRTCSVPRSCSKTKKQHGATKNKRNDFSLVFTMISMFSMALLLVFPSSVQFSLADYVQCSSPRCIKVACLPNSLSCVFRSQIIFQINIFPQNFPKALERSQIGVIISPFFSLSDFQETSHKVACLDTRVGSFYLNLAEFFNSACSLLSSQRVF